MINIRPEKQADFSAVKTILKLAFANDEHSEQTEDLLVERLRKSPAYIPELALVATLEDEVIGHILLTKIDIVSSRGGTPSLALAPVSVHPDYQNQGFGGALIKTAHQQARQLGYGSIVLLGHSDYYPRFGYKLCRDYGIELPFPAPTENCMILELQEGALTGISGMVKYDQAFFE
jgi:predicted N-acetyltransferase YhbS